MSRMDDRLDALWAEYRTAVPDPEPSAGFMPGLWQKIEARRADAATRVFRRLAQVCVMATVALTLLLSVVLVPSQSGGNEAFFSGTYVDILAADYADNYTRLLPAGDLE
jgi:hypothetical protein